MGPCLVLHCTGRMGQDGPGQEADKTPTNRLLGQPALRWPTQEEEHQLPAVAQMLAKKTLPQSFLLLCSITFFLMTF